MVLCHVFGMNWYEFARVCIRTYMLVFHRELTTDVLVLPLGYLQVWYVLALPPSPPSFPPRSFSLSQSLSLSCSFLQTGTCVPPSHSLPPSHRRFVTVLRAPKPQASSLKPQASSLNPQPSTLKPKPSKRHIV